MSRFTIHGEIERGIADVALPPKTLEKYVIAEDAIDSMKEEVRLLGISEATLFPELDGLSKDLEQLYF